MSDRDFADTPLGKDTEYGDQRILIKNVQVVARGNDPAIFAKTRGKYPEELALLQGMPNWEGYNIQHGWTEYGFFMLKYNIHIITTWP